RTRSSPPLAPAAWERSIAPAIRVLNVMWRSRSARRVSGAADTPRLVLDMDSDVHPLRLCVGSHLPHGRTDQPAAGTSSLDWLEPGPSLRLRLSLCGPDGLFTRHSCPPNPRRGPIPHRSHQPR